MPKRRNYSAEFKREAVALASQHGVTKSQIGRELNINPNMITRWQRELAANGSKTFLGENVLPHITAQFRKALREIENQPDGFHAVEEQTPHD